jgi:hypothetical protein
MIRAEICGPISQEIEVHGTMSLEALVAAASRMHEEEKAVDVTPLELPAAEVPSHEVPALALVPVRSMKS